MHTGWIEPEKLMLLKKGLGRRVIRVARHNEPRNRTAIAITCCADFFSKDLKERFVFQRRDRKRALRTVIAQPRPLSPGDGERRAPTRAQCFFTGRLRLFPRERIAA